MVITWLAELMVKGYAAPTAEIFCWIFQPFCTTGTDESVVHPAALLAVKEALTVWLPVMFTVQVAPLVEEQPVQPLKV